MGADNPLSGEGQDFRRRRAVGDLTDLDYREAGDRARRQGAKRLRAVNFERAPHPAHPAPA